VDLMLVNQCPTPTAADGITLVRLAGNGLDVPVATDDVADPDRPGHHDPARLADALLRLLEERTGPLDLPTAEPPPSGQRLN
jgi:hypothetical protein